ncbi:MAG: DUF465 domain-containing protein [Sandaracinaceae bacterium]
MARSPRRIDPEKQLKMLRTRHSRLKSRVAEYESRLSLTPSEQLDLRRLKKQKLACKDRMERIKD